MPSAIGIAAARAECEKAKILSRMLHWTCERGSKAGKEETVPEGRKPTFSRMVVYEIVALGKSNLRARRKRLSYQGGKGKEERNESRKRTAT